MEEKGEFIIVESFDTFLDQFRKWILNFYLMTAFEEGQQRKAGRRVSRRVSSTPVFFAGL